jgi:hypothetical protein
MRKFASIAALAVIGLPAVTPHPLGAQQADSIIRRQQRSIDSLAAVVREALARLDSVSEMAASVPAAAPARASGAYMNIGFDGLADAGWSTNPDVRALQKGDHDPAVRGFTIPQGEMSLNAVVDPYFKGFSNIVFKLDENGETGVELEELYFLTTSLPHSLQLKGGQFLTDFGRQNATHPHAWSFVDQPLVIGRMFGPEGMRGQGARLSWLLPTSFYTEAMLTVLNPSGGTTFSFLSDESAAIHLGELADRRVEHAKDLVYVPRITGSYDLTDNTTLLLGASAAFGPNNAGPETRTSVYGADLFWKWKSPRAAAGFPFVSFQAEAMARRYDTDARTSATTPGTTYPAELLKDQGGYAELMWGVKPRIVLGLRAERVTADPTLDAESRADRTRLSPNYTWYPTEFSKVRLQYNFDDRAGFGRDHSLWLQFEFIMGAHAAHKF